MTILTKNTITLTPHEEREIGLNWVLVKQAAAR